LTFRGMRRASLITELGWLLAAWTSVSVVTTSYVLWIGTTNHTIAALTYLLVVLVVATLSTRWVAISTSIFAFLCFNFFFFPPVGTFRIEYAEDWVTLFTLLAVSIVASQLSARARRRAQEATARRDELARLFDLTRDILLTTEAADALSLVARYITRRFALEGVAICLPGPGGWTLHESGDSAIELDTRWLDAVLAAARERADTEPNRAADAYTNPGAMGPPTLSLVPLRVGERVIGLLGLKGTVIEARTRNAIAGVTAIAIERAHLLKEREDGKVVRRSNEMKSALLASLSHDLRTPLTAVTVAASNLKASWLSDQERHEQTEIVLAELARLNRLFQNLVDMARIEINAVAAEREWVPPAEIVEAAMRQVEHALGRHRIELDSTAERTLVRLDPRLTSAAVAHVLENAAHYSPDGSLITVQTLVSGDEVCFAVRDRGIGILPEDLEHIFDRSYRGRNNGHHTFGTGMGLAITRGLLAAQGGRVRAENAPGGGAVLTITIPAETQSTPDLEEHSV
jgi:two-component system sensor histidine kinase KdpD